MNRFYQTIPLLAALLTAPLIAQPTHEATPDEIARFPEWREEQRREYQQQRNSTPTNPRAIAEFEPMEAVVISYQSYGNNEFGFNTSFVKTLAEEIRVMILCDDYGVTRLERELEYGNVPMDSITILPFKTDSYWTRDYAPWWIAEGNEQISIVDFVYNRPRDNDDMLNGRFANHFNTPLYKMDLVQCGGNYMVDGINSGTATDLVTEENRDKSESEINQIMEEYLGITNYHVMNDPLGEYIKHVDCWGKYLAADKILIADVAASDPRKADFDAAAAYFETKISPLGTPFEVYRAFSDNEPYTNSLILNDRVFVPIKGGPNDEPALEVYRQAMPGYRIIGIENTTRNPWLHTDALHCRTRGVPDREMLYIAHTPRMDTVVSESTFPLTTVITDFSKKGLVEDSLICYYRVKGEEEFLATALTSDNDSLFTAEIPPHWRDTAEVEYYFSVKDSSGRTSFYPFIGESDPLTLFAAPLSEVSVQPYPGTNRSQLSVIAENRGISVISGYNSGTLSLFHANGRLISKVNLTAGKKFVELDNSSGIVLYQFNNGTTLKNGKLVLK